MCQSKTDILSLLFYRANTGLVLIIEYFPVSSYFTTSIQSVNPKVA